MISGSYGLDSGLGSVCFGSGCVVSASGFSVFSVSELSWPFLSHLLWPFPSSQSVLCGKCSICRTWESIVTPLIVKSDPIQPIMPKYMTRMHVEISGARASPKVCARSADVSIESFGSEKRKS